MVGGGAGEPRAEPASPPQVAQPPPTLPSEPQELSSGLELSLGLEGSFSSMGFPKGDKVMPKFTKSEPNIFIQSLPDRNVAYWLYPGVKSPT